ncbi:MAG: SoxR reducing system RseC family protein [Porphyromonas sp.]|nr:SoxR reducing system RseC family protein [Porphyromonas sp.]
MAEVVRQVVEVKAVYPDRVVVRMMQMSACSGCHAKGFCSSSDCKEREVVVPGAYPELQVGDRVELEGRETLGWWAMLLAFVFPLVVLVASVFLSLSLGLSELYAALVGLGIIALYYLLLSFFGNSLRKKFVFSLRKIYT